MMQPQLTVSRIQAITSVLPDGSATLMSNGKSPTLWRARGGPWNVLYKGQTKLLQDGDQVSLDCNYPEAAVFACVQEAGMQGGYDQQGYGAQLEYGGGGAVGYSGGGGGDGWGGAQQGGW